MYCYTIIDGPKFRYGNATFMKLVQPNLTLVLDCSLEGSSYPSALILYSTTANEVSNAKYNSTTNRITITNAVAGNSGNYTCIATNGLKTVTLQYTMDIGSEFANYNISTFDLGMCL